MNVQNGRYIFIDIFYVSNILHLKVFNDSYTMYYQKNNEIKFNIKNIENRY